jgi:predicted O-methyltransferase YrrM
MDIHPLADRMLTSGESELADGTVVRADSYIARTECELIYRAVAAARATRGVEVGMAYGLSTLCIADALQRTSGEGAPALTVIDPNQSTQWRGAGLHLLHRAGLSHVVTLIERSSQAALPQLVEQGERVRFAFIDGWHTFDHTLVDFFFCDLLLEPGGVVVFDDVGYPAIHAAVRFVLANRDYEMLEALPLERGQRPSPLRRAAKRALRRLARTDRDPSPRSERLLRGIDDVFAVALRKRGDDARRFDHFERF